VIRPGQLFVKSHCKITGVIEAMDSVPVELNWSDCRDTPPDLSEEHRGTLRDVDGDPQFSQLLFKVAEIHLHAANRQAVHR
jgi:hypothetical protein